METMTNDEIVSLCEEYMQTEKRKDLDADTRARLVFYDGMTSGLMIAASTMNEQRLDKGKKVAS